MYILLRNIYLHFKEQLELPTVLSGKCVAGKRCTILRTVSQIHNGFRSLKAWIALSCQT